MRIAFFGLGGAHWPVGPVYFRNLLYAVRQTYGKQVEFFLQARASDETADEYARLVQADGLIRYSTPRRRTFRWAFYSAAHRLFQRDVALENSLRAHQIDALITPATIAKSPRVATLVWLPDFQHVHLPEMFSAEERGARDQMYFRSASLATRLVLMCNTVKTDFVAFAPAFAAKARVLYPVSQIPAVIYDEAPMAVGRRYCLPEKFVYVPAQFWKHKNHTRLFQAVQLLKDQGCRIVVVCTGNSVDYRHPTYFAELWQNLSRWDIRDQIIYLGLVPHDDVLRLMRQSVCVVNASLFEGWGYTAEEARALGKKMLLSDIPTHREQNPPGVTFFDPTSAEALAAQLAGIWHTSDPGPDYALESSARYELPTRLRQCAETFMTIVQEAVREVRR